MRKGELSNTVLPVVYVVFENLLGITPDNKASALQKKAMDKGDWKKAVSYYQLNQNTKIGMRDLYWRHHFNVAYRIDVITFTDPAAVSHILDLLNTHNLLFGNVLYFPSAVELSRELVYDPTVIRVLDPDPEHQFTYGSKGRFCSPDQLDLLRAMN